MSCEFSLFSEATPFAAPVAATVLAVPFGHPFPLFTLRKYRRAFYDRLLLGGCGDPMNDRHNFLRGAVGTNGYFFCFAALATLARRLLGNHLERLTDFLRDFDEQAGLGCRELAADRHQAAVRGE